MKSEKLWSQQNGIELVGALIPVLLTCVVFMSAGNSANAEVRVPAIIGDNMVIQSGMKVRIWGRANPGERVTVQINSHTSSANADQQGHWQTFIGPLNAGGPFSLTIKGNNTLSFRNILVGEVWI